MINKTLEKKINKLDGDIEGLRRAKYYLSNKDEINEIIDVLNKERQIYADEIYLGDGVAYTKCIEEIEKLKDKEIGRDEQIELLELIKEAHDRKNPNISKKGFGLNAWLKHLEVQCTWIEYEDRDIAGLIITDITPRI